jgi:hypothetical protein
VFCISIRPFSATKATANRFSGLDDTINTIQQHAIYMNNKSNKNAGNCERNLKQESRRNRKLRFSKNKTKFQRCERPSNPKRPELVLWVMIIMLLVKFAIILFGNTK